MYLLRVSACISTFYILYLIFFRNSTFFSVNRFYLLVALLFSFIIPGLDFSMVAVDYHLPSVDFLNTHALTRLNDIKPPPIVATSGSENFNFILCGNAVPHIHPFCFSVYNAYHKVLFLVCD